MGTKYRGYLILHERDHVKVVPPDDSQPWRSDTTDMAIQEIREELEEADGERYEDNGHAIDQYFIRR